MDTSKWASEEDYVVAMVEEILAAMETAVESRDAALLKKALNRSFPIEGEDDEYTLFDAMGAYVEVEDKEEQLFALIQKVVNTGDVAMIKTLLANEGTRDMEVAYRFMVCEKHTVFLYKQYEAIKGELAAILKTEDDTVKPTTDAMFDASYKTAEEWPDADSGSFETVMTKQISPDAADFGERALVDSRNIDQYC